MKMDRLMKRQIFQAIILPVFLPVVLGFTNTVLADTGHDHEYKLEFSFFSLVQPLGVCTLGSLVVTFTLGLFRKKLGRRFLKIHMTFALLTIIFALCHGILVLVLY